MVSRRVHASNKTLARHKERNGSSATVKLLLPSNHTAKTSAPDHVRLFQKIHAAFEGLQDNEETDSCETAEPGMRR
ncbi:hypothetical protein GUITHDRAFT_106756 [Guillardia theta CCMP2712]|uniref:Uncharacterized protein n=1 Tax=Guillardia theta (strain CCMP2712) TaxID=905079 RepID=L1JFP6_GUITC|nr:hypothetical protein GUITHDRAFT_106756 [Guillardia theta CCMP2712]EKX47306.1 hypothetical protein GUITHDRAFT_106756 [Guillardia theta CCMP2712]|eukprot:XP_005834286.1 hypothetical protein GUITHDRAFT_106756 [Guillardia theta CCMP2712]